MKRTLIPFALAVGLFLSTAPALDAAEPLFAKSVVGKYWDGFKEYWGGAFKNQSAVTMIVLGTGALGLFIITRGRWKK